MLAAAGLKRLGLAERIRALFEPGEMLPCAGQGALGLEVRADAAHLLQALQTLQHTPTALAVQAERAVSRSLGGSCSMPLAAHAVWRDGVLCLSAALGHPEHTDRPLLRAAGEAAVDSEAEARALGERVAAALRDAGAAAYLAAAASAV